MSTETDAAREGARQDSGQFGEQNLTDPGQTVLAAPIDEDTFDAMYTRMPGPDGSSLWEYADLRAVPIPIDRIWTMTEGDNESMTLSPGYSLVNKVGYMVTEQPWTDPHMTVALDGPDDDVPLLTDLVSAEVAEQLRSKPLWIQAGPDPTTCPECGSRTQEQDIKGEEDDGIQLHTCLRSGHQFLACWPGDDDCPECGAGLEDDGICPNCGPGYEKCPQCSDGWLADGTCSTCQAVLYGGQCNECEAWVKDDTETCTVCGATIEREDDEDEGDDD